jgi:futalosine hydrolase
MVQNVQDVPGVPGVLVLAATTLESKLLQSAGAKVVVTGIGAVNTAHALTQHLATNGTPSLVVQMGVAGAYVPADVAVGSVLLADTEIYGDLGVLTPHGWQPMEEIGIPLLEASLSHPARFNYFPLDARLVERAEAAAGNLVERTGKFLTVSQVTGVRAVGDVLYKRFGALCESMEGAAAAHVCAMHGVPFLEVRGVSNLVEDRDRSKWRLLEAANAAQTAVMKILANL